MLKSMTAVLAFAALIGTAQAQYQSPSWHYEPTPFSNGAINGYSTDGQRREITPTPFGNGAYDIETHGSYGSYRTHCEPTPFSNGGYDCR